VKKLIYSVLPTSDFGSNIFFNSKHSVATPTVSIVGLVSDGTEKPAKCNPPRGATEACVREATAGATPEAPPRTGAGTTELLTAGEESEPAMLHQKVCEKQQLDDQKASCTTAKTQELYFLRLSCTHCTR